MPDGVYWHNGFGEYLPMTSSRMDLAGEWYARLDTFTRCQETTDVYVSLVDEMVAELEHVALYAYGCVPLQTQDILDRAKQIMGIK